MPILKNERHELFAQQLAQGKSATEAYELAGFKPSRKNASRLRAKEDVGARVCEIQAVAARSAEITLEGILRELDEAITIAKHKGQPNALINAASLRSRLGGLLTEKVEITTKNATSDNASPDEILQAFWHSCTNNCPDIELSDDDREILDLVLQLLRKLEDDMIGRQMQRTIAQDRAARQAITKASPAEIEYKRVLSDRERLFNSGLFNSKGRPHG